MKYREEDIYIEVRLSFIKYRVRASRKCEKDRGGL
jgi:hypothetical protein